jgi:hypothetical protein
MFLDEMDKLAVIARALWRVLGRTKAVQVSAQIQAMAKLVNERRSWAAPPLDQAQGGGEGPQALQPQVGQS